MKLELGHWNTNWRGYRTVSDFHQDDENSTVRINEKGDKHRTIGLHYAAAEAIREYIEQADLSRGPLFRPRLNSRSAKLGTGHMQPLTMYRVVQSYLECLPGSMQVATDAEGNALTNKAGDTIKRCVYSPHSLRATTATLLLDAAVDIVKVQELLGHKHVTTTQVYDKRRRGTKESASHDVTQ